jgi:hypothetical protein
MKKSLIAISLVLATSAAFASTYVTLTKGNKTVGDVNCDWTSTNPSDTQFINSDEPVDVTISVVPGLGQKSDGVFVRCDKNFTKIWVKSGSSFVCKVGNVIGNTGGSVSWSDDGSKQNPYGATGFYNIHFHS